MPIPVAPGYNFAMRLDKFLSHASTLSRSDAKRAIKSGRVSVNRETAGSPGQIIQPDDQVQLDNSELQLFANRYLMLHKPAGFICASQDADHPTVLDLVDEPGKGQLHSAGRLDKDTTGLVLLTDDGQWSHRVTTPNKETFKRYRVMLAEPITEEAANQLRNGVQLHGEKQPTRPAMVEITESHQILLSISEGKYHQVKRMLAAVGNHVIGLHREAIGPLTLDDDLQPGQYRPLTPTEIDYFS